MHENLDKDGLRSKYNDYDLFFIDIWGVIHNGVSIFTDAVNVLESLKKNNKEFILLTNAPRPNLTVVKFLQNLGLKDFYENVYTSGEASLKYLIENYQNSKFFHIGPPRDFDLFKEFQQNKMANIEEAEYFICTGLFEEYETNLDYYKELLTKFINKKLICTNPDLIVDRGEVREFCAGSVAKIFEEIGGEVIYFGKPHPPVYNLAATTKNKKILCIGDNMNTDIKGANVQNYDSLLITNGIHRQEIENIKTIGLEKKYAVEVDYIQTNLKW